MASVRAVLAKSAFLGSPSPALMIYMTPPKTVRAKRRTPARVRELRRMREIRWPRLGKVWETVPFGPQLIKSPISKARTLDIYGRIIH